MPASIAPLPGVAAIIAKRLRQQPIDAQLARIAKDRDADGHAVVAGFGHGTIGAEQTIPPWQIEAEIAVGLTAQDGVVHPMHVGRHHQPTQQAVERGRHRHIGMIEGRGRVQHHLEQQHRHHRNAERDHDRDLDSHGNQNLERMEAPAGGDVDVEIGVVHAVQPPQHRHFVEQDVLGIDDEIERQEAQQRRDREPQAQEMEEPPSAAGREQRGADRGGRNEDAHGEHVDEEDAEIVRPAQPPADGERPARGGDLPQRHGGEDEGERTDPNQEFEVHRRRQNNEEAAAAQPLPLSPERTRNTSRPRVVGWVPNLRAQKISATLCIYLLTP